MEIVTHVIKLYFKHQGAENEIQDINTWGREVAQQEDVALAMLHFMLYCHVLTIIMFHHNFYTCSTYSFESSKYYIIF